MRCAVHGSSVNCPPFCTHQLLGTEEPGTPGGPRITDELARDSVRDSDDAVRNPDEDSKARDLATADRDVSKARENVARALQELSDLQSAVDFTRQSLQDCDALLRKYDGSK